MTERGMQLLAQASEMDIETFFATWRGYLRRLTGRDIETMPQGRKMEEARASPRSYAAWVTSG